MGDKIKLTAKQERFCQEYIVTLNATQAAAKAGYKQAKASGTENLAKPTITKRIAELQAPVLKAIGINAEYVLIQAQKLHERCMEDDTFNAAGAAKALEIIGKHVDVQAFLERHKVDLPNQTPDTTTVPKTDWAMLRQARKAIDEDSTVH